jgi:hypothetical protein
VTYLVHGTLVETTLPLFAARSSELTDPTRRMRIVIEVVEPGDDRLRPQGLGPLVLRWLEADDPPEDVVTVHQQHPADPLSRANPQLSSYVVSYAGRRMLIHLHRSNSEEDGTVADVFVEDIDGDRIGLQTIVEGWLVSLVLCLAGQTVLHASAIEAGGELIAFAGPSGQGKSTLAALACVGGASLFADDVLRVTQHSQRFVGYRGSTSLRLRDDATTNGPLSDLGLRHQVDGRTMFQPAMSLEELAPISAIVFPYRDDAAVHASLDRIAPARGAVPLLGCQRVYRWVDADQQRRTFHSMSLIANHVPLYRLTAAPHSVRPDDLLAMLRTNGLMR